MGSALAIDTVAILIQAMPKREEQLTRAMVGRQGGPTRLTEEEIIERERLEREQKILRKKFAEGTGEVVKVRVLPISKQQLKKDKLAAREAELSRLYYEQNKDAVNESVSAT